MKIKDLFIKDIKYEERKRKPPVCLLVSRTSRTTDQRLSPAGFENRVLDYLNKNRDTLGIAEIYKLENMLIDLAIVLDGKIVLLEIKYVLNWENCCNARIEIQGFIGGKSYEKLPTGKLLERALVVFDRFSGDWDRKPEAHSFKNGWNFFYEEETVLRKMFLAVPVDIAQLTEKGLENPFLG